MAISNPKIILFWIAFIPKLIKEESLNAYFIAIVVSTFVFVEGVAEMLLVLLGNAIQPILKRYLKTVERLSAIVFFVFAIVVLTN